MAQPRLSRLEAGLLFAALGCAGLAAWDWWRDRPALQYQERVELAGMTVHEPHEFAVELRNEGDEPRKVIGARAF